ncbi:unnamed protein product [Urochloa decumbens]|uniref:RING-type domain-containing protein n=1 Tax=Urochloa decumbens TaxID=240449 RepID=A0ABC9EGD3_9POAL
MPGHFVRPPSPRISARALECSAYAYAPQHRRTAHGPHLKASEHGDAPRRQRRHALVVAERRCRRRPSHGVLTVGSIATVAGTLLIFVVIAAGLVYLQYVFDVRHGVLARRRRGGGILAVRGVDPDVLRSLPVTVYRAAPPDLKDAAMECAVCLTELEDGEGARFLPRCGHGFHAECVDTGDLVIKIPEQRVSAPSLRDAVAKSPGSARLRSSFRRLWSFGRQGAGASSSCSFAGEGADLEQGQVSELPMTGWRATPKFLALCNRAVVPM